MCPFKLKPGGNTIKLRLKDLEKVVGDGLKLTSAHLRVGEKKERADLGTKKVKSPKTNARRPQ